MRTFKVIAGERVRREDDTPLVEFIISDLEKGVAIRCDIPYGELDSRTRDEAYAMLKDIAAASIRQRVANDVIVPVTDCPNFCTRGYVRNDDGSLGTCSHIPCYDYADAVNCIGEIVDIKVLYRPGTHENGDFPL
jgi:hypothetical protein